MKKSERLLELSKASLGLEKLIRHGRVLPQPLSKEYVVMTSTDTGLGHLPITSGHNSEPDRGTQMSSVKDL